MTPDLTELRNIKIFLENAIQNGYWDGVKVALARLEKLIESIENFEDVRR